MAVASRGVVLEERGVSPVFGTLELAEPGPGEVLVRMAAAGLCHTDISAVRDARVTPLVLGHEGAGIVEQVGKHVADLTPGTPVLLCWKPPCGTCPACRRGAVELCASPLDVPVDRVQWQGHAVTRLLGTGCFSEFVLVPARAAIPLPDGDRLAEASLIGCAVATGLGAALRTADVRPGSSAVVFGAGGVGLNVVLGCALAHASVIVAVDPSEERRALASHRGATHVATPEEAQDAVAEATGGRGADYAFEVVGVPAVMQEALGTLGRGGTLVLIGAAARDAQLAFPPRAFMSRQQSITGCIYGSIRPYADLPLFVSWWSEGKIPLGDLIGETVPLEALPEAFADGPRAGVRTAVSFL